MTFLAVMTGTEQGCGIDAIGTDARNSLIDAQQEFYCMWPLEKQMHSSIQEHAIQLQIEKDPISS